MKTIGLIGGMSFESTVPYYRHINERVKARLGGLHSARVILYSVDFHEIEAMQREGAWQQSGAYLARIALALETAGAELLVLCSNTMHKVADAVGATVRIPLLHIVDATASQLVRAGIRTVGLLGTRFTMEEAFYRARLEARAGARVLVPDERDRALVDRIIYEELCQGRIVEASRAAYRDAIRDLIARGAQGVVLGCTEISLLVAQSDSAVPLFDTTLIHAAHAADRALDDHASADGQALADVLGEVHG